MGGAHARFFEVGPHLGEVPAAAVHPAHPGRVCRSLPVCRHLPLFRPPARNSDQYELVLRCRCGAACRAGNEGERALAAGGSGRASLAALLPGVYCGAAGPRRRPMGDSAEQPSGPRPVVYCGAATARAKEFHLAWSAPLVGTRSGSPAQWPNHACCTVLHSWAPASQPGSPRPGWRHGDHGWALSSPAWCCRALGRPPAPATPALRLALLYVVGAAVEAWLHGAGDGSIWGGRATGSCDATVCDGASLHVVSHASDRHH